jgi:hypothetical protein
MFSYFKDNGQDGLRLANSLDSYNWIALKTWQDISDKIHFPEGTRQGAVFTLSKNE